MIATVGASNRWVIAAAVMVMQLGLGSFYAWSVFRAPLSELYATNVTDVNIAFFLASLTFTLAAFSGGLLMRWVSPRVIGVAGGVLYGLGVFLASFADESLLILYLAYGVVGGIGNGLGYIAPVAALPEWFPDRPGLAYGMAVCGYGAGSAVTTPIATYLISSTGGPLTAFGILGLAYVVLIGGAALFVKAPPGHHEPEVRETTEQVEGEKSTGRGWSLREALKSWQWYALWIIFFLHTTVGLAIISDAKTLAASLGGATAALASFFVVIVAAGDATGRLVWPALSDRIGPRGVFMAMFLLQAAAFLLLPLLGADTFLVFSLLSFVVLTCYGGGYGTMPAFVYAYYGSRDVGAIYGSMIVASGVAGFGAPVLLAHSVDATGSYSPALYVMAALMLVGTLISLFLRPPESPQ